MEHKYSETISPQVLRRPASREQAQALSSDLHTMAMDLQDRELGRLDTVRLDRGVISRPALVVGLFLRLRQDPA